MFMFGQNKKTPAKERVSLTPDIAEGIIRYRRMGITIKKIAEFYNISQGNCSQFCLKNRLRSKDIKDKIFELPDDGLEEGDNLPLFEEDVEPPKPEKIKIVDKYAAAYISMMGYEFLKFDSSDGSNQTVYEFIDNDDGLQENIDKYYADKTYINPREYAEEIQKIS